MTLILKNIKQLVTVAAGGKRVKAGVSMRDIGVIENAAVIIENNLITWCGQSGEIPVNIPADAHIIDCTDLVGLPGFVDSHTHTVFAGTREDEFAMRSEGMTYQQIAERGGGILNSVRATRQATKKELKKFAGKRLDAMLRQGTTTIEIKSGYCLDPEGEVKMLEVIRELSDEHLLDVVGTFLGAHAFPPEFKDNHDGYIELLCSNMIPYISKKKLATFCDVFCEKSYFSIEQSRKILTTAREHGLQLKIHADQLIASGGAALAVELGTVSADHLECIPDKDIPMLANSNVVGVVLPGASFFLNHTYPPARKLIDSGAAIAIATDFNPGSSMSYSMPLMMTIACTHMKMTPEETITAATFNGAAALGMEKKIGSIEPGKQADIILYDIPNYRYLPYHYGENHVAKVIKAGVYLEY
jgi:imidazolonepropionase